ncbi:MAG: tRNA lysidine(34) synthetase TilS [Lactovum sp.]
MKKNKQDFLRISQKKQYFKKSSKVLIALSTGQDSMTLFEWLYQLREKLQIEISVAHVNHKQREASEYEEKFVRKKMTELKIPYFISYFQGKFTEDTARKFRYDFFDQVMRENDIQTLVTAHHKGDQAETFFMRLMTGRRLRHLTGIEERQDFSIGELIRPLLSFEKKELDTSFFFEDQTNHENDHLRNRIRNIYLPSLEKENPRLKSALVDLSDEIKKSQYLISQQIDALNILSDKINLKKFLSQSEELQYFILQAYVEAFQDFQVHKGHFDNLLAIIRRSSQFDKKINKDYFFIKNDFEFYLIKTRKKKKVQIATENPNNESFSLVFLEENMDYELRARKMGDFIVINGVKRKLKKLFIDKKVSLEDREVFVLSVDSEIHAIPILNMTSDLSQSLENATIKKRIWLKVKEG